MSYGNRIPVRESLLDRLVPLLDAHKGNLVVLEYDVQLKTVTVGSPPNVQTHDSWCVVLIVAGALIGEENRLSYVWNFGMSPQVPDDRAFTDGIREALRRLGLMRTKQLQALTPPESN
jgi:hypothetical protein